MADDLDALVHDATSVFRFVDFICEFCYQQENHQAYSVASRRFFKYIADLGKSTKEHIQADIDDAQGDPTVIGIYRTGFATIKKCWARVHEFVKLVADGHALQTPTPLLDFMEWQISTLPGLENSSIVILISEELNYFQYQHSRLKDFAVDFSLTIPGSPEFPEKLAFIGIPFSQRITVFNNALIYHELGHFAFEELRKRKELDICIDAALTKKLQAKYSSMSVKEKQWHRNQLATWAEETFCDLFALWLIGPAYAFASIELLCLLDFLKPADATRFDTEHPCFAFRFHEHVEQLTEHGWWNAIETLNCEHPKLIKEIAAIKDTEYTSVPQEALFDDELIPAFLLIRDDIRALVKATVDNRDCGLGMFEKVRAGVEECLSEGIVPSVLYTDGAPPLAPALINASFAFYLQSLSLLIKRIDGPGPFDLDHRSEISNRLEMWTLKSIEDCNLLTRHSVKNKQK